MFDGPSDALMQIVDKIECSWWFFVFLNLWFWYGYVKLFKGFYSACCEKHFCIIHFCFGQDLLD